MSIYYLSRIGTNQVEPDPPRLLELIKNVNLRCWGVRHKKLLILDIHSRRWSFS